MAKKGEFLSSELSKCGRFMTFTIAGCMPVQMKVEEAPQNVKTFWMRFGARQSITNVISARKENNWSNATCDQKVRAKITAFEQGLTTVDKSPISNWEDLFRAIAETRGKTIDEIRAQTNPTHPKYKNADAWIAAAADYGVVQKMLGYEQERATAALAARTPGAKSAVEDF